MKPIYAAILCAMAFGLAGLAGAVLFNVTHGPARLPVELPEMFPQPCALRSACVADAPAPATTQVTLN